MKNVLQSGFRKTFFYSSRQIRRRPRMYLSVFVTSVVLVTLVMTALELLESYYLRSLELSAVGTYDASILSQPNDEPNDESEQIAQYPNVERVAVVPWTSRLASSVAASDPGKLVVETPELDELLGVHYIWGNPPEDGEIAVPRQLYEQYRYFMAGEETELFFKAAEMTYEPMKISGVFTVYDETQSYVLVTEKTAAKIDKATGAHDKYDHYLFMKRETVLQTAKIVRTILTDLRIGDTDEQARDFSQYQYNDFSELTGTPKVLADYINSRHIEQQEIYEATPVVLYSLPVIAVAALILTVFMMNWTESHAAELGMLGAIGADRVDLCLLVAGQVLIITVIASIPVIFLASLLSRIYINAFNAAGQWTGLVFTIPWWNLIKAALWFVFLSTVFTMFGIWNLTRADPFPLISGSYRKKMPFVRNSSEKLKKSRNKVKRLALLQSLRQFRSDVLPAAITSLISLVVGGVLLLTFTWHLLSGTMLSDLVRENPADTVIRTQDSVDALNPHVPLYAEDEARLRSMPEVERVGAVAYFTGHSFLYGSKTGDGTAISPRVKTASGWEFISVAVVNPDMLPLFVQDTDSFDADAFFSEPGQAIVVSTHASFAGSPRAIGDTLTLAAETTYRKHEPVYTPDDLSYDLTVVSVQPSYKMSNNILLVSPKTAEAVGLGVPGEYDALYVDYDRSLTDGETEKIVTALSNDPVFMRYDVTHLRIETAAEAATTRAVDSMFLVFGFMLWFTFCMAAYMNANIKAARSRRDYAILRQLGADDGQIRTTVRVGVRLVTAMVFAFICVLTVAVSFIYLSKAMQALNIAADRFPESYTPEVYAEYKRGYFMVSGVILLLGLCTTPIQLICHVISLAGTFFPTRRMLREPITEGIRKDTD